MPPVSPMLAKAVKGMPTPDSTPAGLLYEPKWDGFRCIVFRDGDEVELGSRNERPLTRYFPDIVEAVKAQLPERCVVDGEIVIVTPTGLDFDALQMRLHPADSRVRKLAAETPASFVAFDLLAIGDESLMEEPLSVRRSRLEQALASAAAPVYLTPATYDVAEAEDWFTVFEGAGLDGVIAKPLDITYKPDVRAMFKVKHARTADCVVAGFRWHKTGPIVGFTDPRPVRRQGRPAPRRRRRVVHHEAPRRAGRRAGPVPRERHGRPPVGGLGRRQPGGRAHARRRLSRWNAGKDLSWEPLRPELVVEVAYDQMQGDRFRHATQFVRWRTDRDPSSCNYEQLEKPVKFALADIFS